MNFFRDVLMPILLCAATAACNRDGPEATPTNPPGGTQSLQPIAQFFLGTHVAEPSGIVYHHKNNSLLVVSDSHPEIYEIDFAGTLIRTITTSSTDLEGISISASCDTIYVVEERARLVVSYRSGGARLSSFSADVATLANNALEGVTVGKGGNLFVLNEMAPGMLLEYTPGGMEIRRIPLSIASDYSDIVYDETQECLWIISDESQKIMKTDLNGSLRAEWLLPFSKGEGIAIVRDTMYVVNDADATMYLFRVPK